MGSFRIGRRNNIFANISMMLKIKSLVLAAIVVGIVYAGYNLIPKYSDSLGLFHSSKNTVASLKDVPCVTPLRTISSYDNQANDLQFIVFQYSSGTTFGQTSTVLKAVGIKQAPYTSQQNIVGFMVPKSDKADDMVNKIKSFPFITKVNTSAVCRTE